MEKTIDTLKARLLGMQYTPTINATISLDEIVLPDDPPAKYRNSRRLITNALNDALKSEPEEVTEETPDTKAVVINHSTMNITNTDWAMTSYHGKPLLVLNQSARYPFSFGVKKAQMILDNLELIKQFVQQCS